MAEVDKGRRADALYKWYQLVENRANEAERETKELRLNLKSRAEEERGFAQKLASGRHYGRGG